MEHLVEERTRERELALAQLFEAQKLDTIGQLTGGVAHDFNNLLMAVLGSLELLKKRLETGDERSHRLLNNAVQGAERGAALTQRLLAFARRQELRPQTVDLAGLVQGMLDLLERALGPGVPVQVSIPEELPAVQVDANQLELAILNLAVNARDAMPLGGSLFISARLQDHTNAPLEMPALLPPGDYVCIEVADSGIGMDEATLARASEPFFTTKGPGKGTGLGLSMVHGLAAQSGGAMTLSSKAGTGTTVRLWLPRSHAVPGPSPYPGRTEAETDLRRRASAPSIILLVDDDVLVRTGTVAMLEDLGHVVIEACSGMEALDRLADQGAPVDVVITDHAMPGMKGLDLIRLLQTSHPQLPVILASGYAEITNAENAEGLPRLSKPFRQAELASAIAKVVGENEGHVGNVVSFRS